MAELNAAPWRWTHGKTPPVPSLNSGYFLLYIYCMSGKLLSVQNCSLVKNGVLNTSYFLYGHNALLLLLFGGQGLFLRPLQLLVSKQKREFIGNNQVGLLFITSSYHSWCLVSKGPWMPFCYIHMKWQSMCFCRTGCLAQCCLLYQQLYKEENIMERQNIPSRAIGVLCCLSYVYIEYRQLQCVCSSTVMHTYRCSLCDRVAFWWYVSLWC